MTRNVSSERERNNARVPKERNEKFNNVYLMKLNSFRLAFLSKEMRVIDI